MYLTLGTSIAKKKLSLIKKTYYSIIIESIENSPNKEQYVHEIYEYLYANYSEYLHANWKNSVRHALSYKKIFLHNKTSTRVGTWRVNAISNITSSDVYIKRVRNHKNKNMSRDRDVMARNPLYREGVELVGRFLSFINN